ncbi:MAG: tetratricopeptide repeat protein, partial [Flavobacteriales bacterium]
MSKIKTSFLFTLKINIFFWIMAEIFLPLRIFAQNNDSLIAVFHNEKHTVNERLKAIASVNWGNYSNPPEKGIELIDKAIKMYESKRNLCFLADLYKGKVQLLQIAGNKEEFDLTVSEAISISKKGECYVNLFNFYYLNSVSMFSYDNVDLQKKWLDSILNHPLIDSFPNKKALAYSGKANLYFGKGEYRRTIPYLQKAIILQNSTGFYEGVCHEQMLMGISYQNLGMMDSAYFWYYESLSTIQSHKITGSMGTVAYNLAYAYQQDSKSDSAIKYFVIAEQKFSESGDLIGNSLVNQNLAQIYYDNGNIEKAEKYYVKAIEGINKSSSDYYKARCN